MNNNNPGRKKSCFWCATEQGPIRNTVGDADSVVGPDGTSQWNWNAQTVFHGLWLNHLPYDAIVYMASVHDVAPETGRLHNHYALRLSVPQEMSYLQKRFPDVDHWEIVADWDYWTNVYMHGEDGSNKNHHIEDGDRTVPDLSNDDVKNQMARKYLRVGKVDFAVIHPGVYVDKHSGYQELVATYHEAGAVVDKRIVLLYGGTGAGKSLIAQSLLAQEGNFGPADVVCRFDKKLRIFRYNIHELPYTNGMWPGDGYDPIIQPVCIWNDADLKAAIKEMGFAQMMLWYGEQKSWWNTKRSRIGNNCHLHFITMVDDPVRALLEAGCNRSQVDQFVRRMTNIMEVVANGIFIDIVDHTPMDFISRPDLHVVYPHRIVRARLFPYDGRRIDGWTHAILNNEYRHPLAADANSVEDEFEDDRDDTPPAPMVGLEHEMLNEDMNQLSPNDVGTYEPGENANGRTYRGG
jgi:hypothetical protein